MCIKIIDLNTDCLEYIFKLLNFRDLLNVADSNKLLNSIAFDVISRRYQMKPLALILEGSQIIDSFPAFREEIGEIRILHFIYALRILRNFGRACTKITINYLYMSMRRKKEIEYYLGAYCSKSDASLTTIQLENSPNNALYSVRNQLQTVEMVIITGNSKMDFEQLNKKVPNMKCLKLTWLQISNPTCIERKFPALKQFQVEVRDRLKYFDEDNVQKAIQMNPQLTDILVTIHKHPELNEKALAAFFKRNFKFANKTKYMVKPPFNFHY